MATEDSRKRLDDLHKALVEHMEGPLLGLQEVNPQDLAPFNIECLSFDLEASDDEIPSIEPLYLFGPLAQKTLDEHPIDLNMKMAIHQSRSYTSLNVPGSVMSMRISCSSRPGSWTCLSISSTEPHAFLGMAFPDQTRMSLMSLLWNASMGRSSTRI